MADDLNLTGEDINISGSTSVETPSTPNLDVSNSIDSVSTIENMPITSSDLGVTQDTLPPGVVNFDNPYPDMPGYDVETFESALNFATEGTANLEINQSFKNMIDEAAVDLDKYPISFAPNNDLNDLYPGRSADNYNPFRQSSGVPDMNTANGRRAFQSQAMYDSAINNPDQTPGYEDPHHYGAKRYEMDRYYNHPMFDDNEQYYQANSSKWDNFTRTRGQWTATFGPAFTSQWRSISDMVTGDTFSSDLVGAKSMMDSQRIGRSGSGGTRGFFNDLFLNSSYTAGILSSIAVEELALFGLAAGQGFTNPAADAALVARSTWNIARTAKTIGSLFKMKTYTSAGANMMFKLNQVNSAKRFWAASRSGARSLGNNLGEFLTPELL